MILGYKKKFPWGTETNFKRKIQAGIKKHTIREDVHDRWHSGRKIQHAHGVRTKLYEEFCQDICSLTQRIYIGKTSKKNEHLYYTYNGINYGVIVDGKWLTFSQIVQLAVIDGFDKTDDFFQWFQNGFKGKIIHWTDLKY